MVKKTYTYRGTEYRTVRAVQRAIWEAEHFAFSTPKDAEGWRRYGVIYTETEIKPAPETEEQALARLTEAVQMHLDRKAAELNYDSCLSVCSYVDTGVKKFDEEGAAFRAWRSAVWAKCYEILDEVTAGTRGVPDEAELISELPELVIAYSEG